MDRIMHLSWAPVGASIASKARAISVNSGQAQARNDLDGWVQSEHFTVSHAAGLIVVVTSTNIGNGGPSKAVKLNGTTMMRATMFDAGNSSYYGIQEIWYLADQAANASSDVEIISNSYPARCQCDVYAISGVNGTPIDFAYSSPRVSPPRDLSPIFIPTNGIAIGGYTENGDNNVSAKDANTEIDFQGASASSYLVTLHSLTTGREKILGIDLASGANSLGSAVSWGPPATLSFEWHSADVVVGNPNTPVSFSNKSIGAAADDRIVVVSLHHTTVGDTGTAQGEIINVKIDGVSMIRGSYAHPLNGTQRYCSEWWLPYPTGTSADISVEFGTSGWVYEIGINVGSIRGSFIARPVNSVVSAAYGAGHPTPETAASASVTVPSNGVSIISGICSGPPNTTNWTGAILDHDNPGADEVGTMAHLTTSGTVSELVSNEASPWGWTSVSYDPYPPSSIDSFYCHNYIDSVTSFVSHPLNVPAGSMILVHVLTSGTPISISDTIGNTYDVGTANRYHPTATDGYLGYSSWCYCAYSATGNANNIITVTTSGATTAVINFVVVPAVNASNNWDRAAYGMGYGGTSGSDSMSAASQFWTTTNKDTLLWAFIYPKPGFTTLDFDRRWNCIGGFDLDGADKPYFLWRRATSPVTKEVPVMPGEVGTYVTMFDALRMD